LFEGVDVLFIRCNIPLMIPDKSENVGQWRYVAEEYKTFFSCEICSRYNLPPVSHPLALSRFTGSSLAKALAGSHL
jgi:hypothetical protein